MLLCNNKKFIGIRFQINKLRERPKLGVNARILYFKLISSWFNTKMFISINTFQFQHITYLLFGLYFGGHRTRAVGYIRIRYMSLPIEYILLNGQVRPQKGKWWPAWGSEPNSFIRIVLYSYRNFFSQDITCPIRKNDNFLLFVNGGWFRNRCCSSSYFIYR